MATVSKTIQRFIVQQLACFESPSEVAEAVKAEFSVTITRQAVEHYDPTKGGEGKRLSKDHIELFNVTRERFLSRIDALAISHKIYRLSQLELIMRRAKSRGNWGLAAQMLEQAAKEVGDAYTNRRELTGKNGGAIATVGLSLEQWQAQATLRLKEAESTLAMFEEGEPT